jgi:hypothetical protein
LPRMRCETCGGVTAANYLSPRQTDSASLRSWATSAFHGQGSGSLPAAGGVLSCTSSNRTASPRVFS